MYQVVQRGPATGYFVGQAVRLAHKAQVCLQELHIRVAGRLAHLSLDPSALVGITTNQDHPVPGTREAICHFLPHTVCTAGHKGVFLGTCHIFLLFSCSVV